ncbi:AMP-binding protein [Streptomyces aidingensis]|uniref:Acetyl-CoA synthetase n=1 Tax=Streptomyces aidingensis TaxID=910347 RepID=A0A1I1H1G1_9ACTN|nr:AMP-binding protein [Streptomyces aidingensis]SFC17887.1 acetyl-CoA synthetase [Streptomyces aidingensis]
MSLDHTGERPGATGRAHQPGTAPADVLTHVQLLDRGKRAASLLAGLGVRSGDRVAVALPMCLESLVITLACVRIGALRVSLPPGDGSGLVRHRLRTSGARVVVTADSCRHEGTVLPVKAALERALAGSTRVETVLVVQLLARPVPWTPGRDLWWHETPAVGEPPGHEGLPGTGPYPEDMSQDLPEPPPDSLIFDDPLAGTGRDDSDLGWGGHPAPEGGTAGDLARFLDEKPPHHL